MIDSEVRNMNPLHYIQIHFQKWKESTYCRKHIAMTKAILSSRLSFKNCCMLTDSPKPSFYSSHPIQLVCLKQEHRGSFLLALKSIAVSANMSPTLNFANSWIRLRMDNLRILRKEEVITDQLFLYHERNNHFYIKRRK